ncbi:MAG: hypothetical protein PHX83_11995 [Acidobacteriia bacterium]|nr:hypothetical protein [Terriglobia bacterium]
MSILDQAEHSFLETFSGYLIAELGEEKYKEILDLAIFDSDIEPVDVEIEGAQTDGGGTVPTCPYGPVCQILCHLIQCQYRSLCKV